MKLTKPQIVFLSIIALLAIFALWDGIQIKAVYQIEDPGKWDYYNQFAAPAFIIAVLLTFAVVGAVAFIFTKDKGLGVGTFVAGTIMFFSGVEDTLFFILGTQEMTPCMQWFNDSGHWVSYVSNLLGETCVSPTALILSSVVGIFVAYKAFEYIRLKY